jgi:CDP-glycerol glycerophosphotransferase (TagB/SpsB family)
MTAMMHLVKRLARKVSRDLITVFTKRRANRIVLITESLSGSNTYALWKNASKDLLDRFDVIIYQDVQEKDKEIRHFFRKYRLISSAQLIITTHASYKPSRHHIHFQLWHGSSIKTSGVMEHKKGEQKFELPWKTVDYIMSYSETYTTFLNAQMLSVPWKYKITGAPRNDFLFHSDGISNLTKVLGSSIKGKKIIFHLPTWRGTADSEPGSRNEGNIFGFSEFAATEFDSFLADNNCTLIFKPHPHENEMALNFINKHNLTNVLIFSNDDLMLCGLDLYEVLNAADILITDFSSVYNDFLLLDRPIVFASGDLDAYCEGRGFMVESFHDWAPGAKAANQNELQLEISNYLTKEDRYSEKRAWQLKQQHRYKDGNSSQRMWEFISTIM